MAIVKMKRLRTVALREQRAALLRDLLRLGCVEISEPDAVLAEPRWAALLRREDSALLQTRTRAAEVRTALEAVEKYGGVKNGLFIRRRSVGEAEFLGEMSAAAAAADMINARLREISRLDSEESQLQARRAALLPWRQLDMPLELSGTAHCIFRTGVCPAAVELGQLRTDLAAAAPGAELLQSGGDRQLHYLLLICHREDEGAAMDVLRPRGFSAVSFPEVTGPAEENLRALDGALAENRRKREQAAADIAAQVGAREALQTYADRLTAELDSEENTERLVSSGSLVFFEGWVPAERLADVEALLDRMDCAWEAEDPDPKEYGEVPVQLKNNWLTRPLNMVTEMYSLPAYGSVDPNPLMAPFFILFYGIMMADMGYGLLMILASLYIMRTKPNGATMRHMIPLLGLCGVSTFIMGALTGGFFGDFLTQAVKLTTGGDFVLPALFTPLEDTLMILIGSMCLGAVHVLTGMAVSVVSKVRRGRVMDAFWNEITLWIVFAGIALAVMGVTPVVLAVGLGLMVAGPAINGKGIGRITGVFASLYNNVTGYFGDILSYSRLMALMMAGSVIAQVFNTLGTIPGNIVLFLVISMVGNTLNFGLNLLGCYVHDMRLQCLEFFGKFYEDGGRPFRPLQFNTKYVDIQ